MVSPSRSASSSPEPSDTMQLFIKRIGGETITLTVPSTITTEKLTTLLSLRTKLPPSDIRLVYSGHHLSPTTHLSTLGIRSESTLHLASPLLGGMPPKKIRCGAKDGGLQCREGVSRIVGECGFCGGCYCGKHRLLEDHRCAGLEDVSTHPAFASFSDPGTPLFEDKNGKEEEGEEEYFEVKIPRMVQGKENERKEPSSELSVRELGVVINHDGSIENVRRLAGGKPEWWLAGLNLDELGVFSKDLELDLMTEANGRQCKKESHERNANMLNSEKTVAIKGV